MVMHPREREILGSTPCVDVMQIATKTLDAINNALELDDGARFRGLFHDALSEIGDAFNSVPDLLPRSHLGGSLIGRECSRALWYGFRWALHKKNEARLIRLFNRGHLEEARFIALCRVAGLTTWHSENGKQFRITGVNGHYGGSLDGVAQGCPDLPEGANALLEFKTHGKASYKKLVSEGVRFAKPEHYAQCNQYMGFYGLPYTLYMAVDKDTDHLHLEVFQFDRVNYQMHLDKAHNIIHAVSIPPKLNESPAWYGCKFCDYSEICHLGGKMHANCRTCEYSQIREDGVWWCGVHGNPLSKQEQFAGCEFHKMVNG